MSGTRTATSAFLVGLLVAVCFLAFLVAFTFFRKGGYGVKESYVVFAYFDDATGLNWKSPVQIAGIQVGEVEKVSLVGERARLDIRLKNDVVLHQDACLTKKLPSPLLPDALLEVAVGSAQKPALLDLPPDQRQVTCVNEVTGLAKVFDQLSHIAGDIQSVTGDLAKTMGGAQGSIKKIIDNLSEVSATINRTIAENGDKVGAILDDAQGFAHDLHSFSSGEEERLHTVMRNVEVASGQIRNVLDSVQEILGSNQPQLKESVAGLRQALEKLNQSLDQVKATTEKVAEGKGVAGKLLADERLGTRFADAIDGVADYVQRVVALKTEIRLRSEFLLNQGLAKTYFGLKLLPKPDKYYLVELVSDPRGVDTVQSVTTVSGPPGGPTQTNQTTTTTHDERLRFSLELAKRYGPATFRVGVIESSGGVGADLHLLGESLQLSTNVYQFARADTSLPRAKVWANYVFLNHLYATAGADDVLVNWRSGKYPGGPKFAVGRDIFFGLGLFFDDEDLKAILTTVGSSVSGAIPK